MPSKSHPIFELIKIIEGDAVAREVTRFATLEAITSVEDLAKYSRLQLGDLGVSTGTVAEVEKLLGKEYQLGFSPTPKPLESAKGYVPGQRERRRAPRPRAAGAPPESFLSYDGVPPYDSPRR